MKLDTVKIELSVMEAYNDFEKKLEKISLENDCRIDIIGTIKYVVIIANENKNQNENCN